MIVLFRVAPAFRVACSAARQIGLDGGGYASPPEALYLYARGAFGEPIAAMDQDVRDKLAGDGPEMDPLAGLEEPALPKIRAEYGPFESDEDLLMFLFMHTAAYQDFKKKPTADRAAKAHSSCRRLEPGHPRAQRHQVGRHMHR